MSLKQSKIKFKPRIKYTNFDILNSDLALRLELRKKRKKSSWSSAMNNTSSLFYSPNLGTKYKYNYIEIGLYYCIRNPLCTYNCHMNVCDLNPESQLYSRVANCWEFATRGEIWNSSPYDLCELWVNYPFLFVWNVSTKNETFQFRHSSCFSSLVIQLRPFS